MSGEPGGGARSRAFRAALGARTGLQRVDELLARVAPKDRPGLVVFVFHCVFADQAEAESGQMDVHERATVDGLARLIGYFREHGYRFVGAREIEHGLEPGERYAHLTFDDGFANNLRLLELLPREEAHATVFPSIGHVRDGTAFWWNVVYRERHRRGEGTVAAEYARLRQMTTPEVNSYLLGEFGPRALQPAGDVDRPLTVEELRELAASPWVEIGNHTVDHTVLTRCSEEVAAEEVGGAQRWLAEALGEEPFIIAFPNGGASDEVVAICRHQGLRLGVTLAPQRNRLPAGEEERMRLGRQRIVFDRRERARMLAVRSGFSLYAAARGLTVGRAEARGVSVSD